jgi:hypothetical protein
MEIKASYLKLGIIWMAIIVIGCFWLSVRNAEGPVTLSVLPEAPREGESIIATYKLNNPSSQPLTTNFQFYANNALQKEGQIKLNPNSSQTYQYVYDNNLPVGEQLHFLISTQSALGKNEQMVSTPPYPPQVWISFISFASFSTSVMTSMATMAYYSDNITSMGLNIGIILALVLISLLIFTELAGTRVTGGSTILGRLRIRFSTLTWILVIIFIAMVYTRIAMILAS